MANRMKEGIKEFFSSKDDLDYPNEYLTRNRGFQSQNGHATTLPILELTVPMCCEKCQEKVKEALQGLEGATDVNCDQYNQRVTVTGFVDPLMVLRRVKKVKKKSAFFNNATYINATSLPIVKSQESSNRPMVSSRNGFSETRYASKPLMASSGNGYGDSRYVSNSLVRTNSNGFGRFPHEGQMSSMAPIMAVAPMAQQLPRQLLRGNSFGRSLNRQSSFGRVTRYDDREQNRFVPVDLQRDYYGIRRMPSFKNHRYHDAEYISMGDEFRPQMPETRYVSHHVQRPAVFRSQVSFSKLPVGNPYYMQHIESEYY